MADNTEKVNLSQDFYLSLISKVLENKKEEREIYLDRYRRADEDMDSAEQFVLMGKNAVAFLKGASDTTNDMAKVASEIKSIIFKDDSSPSVEVNFNDATRKEIIDSVRNMKKEKDIPEVDTEEDSTDLEPDNLK